MPMWTLTLISAIFAFSNVKPWLMIYQIQLLSIFFLYCFQAHLKPVRVYIFPYLSNLLCHFAEIGSNLFPWAKEGRDADDVKTLLGKEYLFSCHEMCVRTVFPRSFKVLDLISVFILSAFTDYKERIIIHVPGKFQPVCRNCN